MSISQKIQGYISQSSWIRKMFEAGILLKEKYGEENVYDFSLGNPNVPPPGTFQSLIMKISAESPPGIHGYMPNAGFADTREAISTYLSNVHDMAFSMEHIIMTCGAGGALNVILKTLLDDGDEVVIPTPFFVEYRFYIDNHGGRPVLVKTKDDFSLDIEAIDSAITEKTKIVMINSPHNPTGTVYDESSIHRLSKLLEERSRRSGKVLYLISDEPYREIVYDGTTVPSVMKAYPNSIIATSYSKSISIPGERIGFIAINPNLCDLSTTTAGMILCNRILGYVNAPALMQRVIAQMQGISIDSEIYKQKRDLLCDGLLRIGYDIVKPKGAFYLFPKTPIDDVAFVSVLQKYNILAVPGSGFGGPGHMRLAYCVNDQTIINAMEGFEKAYNECAE